MHGPFQLSNNRVLARVLFGSFCQVTGNSHNDIEFRFVDFEHAEICLENSGLPFEWKSLFLDSSLMKKTHPSKVSPHTP